MAVVVHMIESFPLLLDEFIVGLQIVYGLKLVLDRIIDSVFVRVVICVDYCVVLCAKSFNLFVLLLVSVDCNASGFLFKRRFGFFSRIQVVLNSYKFLGVV